MAIILDKEKLLKCHKEQSIGYLIGLKNFSNNDKILILGHCSTSQFDWMESTTFVSRHFPAGCTIVGCYYGNKCKGEELQSLKTKLKDSLIEGHNMSVHIKILVMINSETEQIDVFQLSGQNNDKELFSSSIDNSISVSEYLEKKSVLFHFYSQFTIDLPNKIEGIYERLQEVINGRVLWLPEQQILLEKGRLNKLDTPLKSFNKIDSKIPINMELLEKITTSSSSPSHPLTVTVTPLTTPTVSLPVTIDIIGLFLRDVTLWEITCEMNDTIKEQLSLMSDIIQERDQHCTLSIYHFLLPTQHVPITVTYPHVITVNKDSTPNSTPNFVPDSDLRKVRETFHKRFCLPSTRPFLRKLNREWSPWKREEILINPHISLKLDTDSDGVAMVTGSYGYYHYMQDKFNDKGWGCAYRSLQTLWSWFQYQGYTDQPLPSHLMIQQTLVDCGDKPDSFIGSSQWIGSIEVSTVLNHLLQIDCRINHFSSGSELAGSGRVLQHHFRTQGTPIMIGGGVLAHTILGVDYNEKTGEIKFLILDPHYVGVDDIKLIAGKGCGWKGINFWDQTASYNMCMPLRPNEI